MEKIYLAGAARTPVGSLMGGLAKVSARRMGSIVVSESMRRAGVSPSDVDEVILGSVLQAGLGQNVARQIAEDSGIPHEAPAASINMVCGSGLRSVIDAARIVKCGEGDVIVAGGSESMTGAPYLFPQGRGGCRMGDFPMIDGAVHDGLTCAIEHVHMGITAENIAERFGITREMQDEFAFGSHMKACAAIRSGFFEKEIVPVEIPQRKGAPVVFAVDEHPRPSTTMEALSKLRPAFKENGTVTAGNASGVNDGAAAVTVLSERAVERLSVTPMASITAWAYSGVEPAIMGTGPIAAIGKLLEKTGMKIEDFDLIEANEAFASQAISVAKAFGLYKSSLESRVNVCGGAIALGHPIGASGCRILTTLLYGLERLDLKTGLAALCIGCGMGVAMAVERVS